MDDKKVTVHSLAQEIYDHIELRKSKNEEDDEKRWFLKEGSPEWMRSVILDAGYEADTTLDNSYEMAVRVLGQFADACDDDSSEDDYREAIYEIEPDVYTSDLTSWLNSSDTHVYYLNEVIKEYGGTLDGFQSLASAQSKQIEEFGDLILRDLLERVEDSADEEIDDEDLIAPPQ